MINDYETRKIAQCRHMKLLEEARIASLLKNANANRNGYLDRILSKSGDLLIALGQNLKERHKQEVNLQHSI